MRLIDADELLCKYTGNILTAQTDYAEGMRNIIDDIKNAPTVNAPPAVRCKDCEYFMVFEKPLGKWQGLCHYYNAHSVMKNDFCSRGKVR